MHEVNTTRCSVPILTLNSAEYLEKCLQSVKNFTDVFLFDGNSTDGTFAIAEKYHVPVYKQVDSKELNVKINSFAEMREKSVDLTREDWVLFLDSDEFLSPELTKEIEELLRGNPDPSLAFSFSYKYIINGKVINHAYKSSEYIRLYNKKSGIIWDQHKLVHEKLKIPSTVRVIKLKNCFYGFVPAYGACIKKDKHYLSLVKKKILNKEKKVNYWEVLRSMLKNFFRAGKILLLSFLVWLRWGFRDSLPPHHVWRYVRYHLFLVYYRFLQLFI